MWHMCRPFQAKGYSHGNYIITDIYYHLTQIRNTEVFAFISVLVFKLLIRKVLFINGKDSGNC